MTIQYQINQPITVTDFKTIIQTSTLHRQVDDAEKLARMLNNADFLITAWDGSQIVGYLRGLTDYADVAYIADLGVAKDHWRQGIGRKLMEQAIELLGPKLHIVLLASELAADYYQKIGFTKDPRGYIKAPTQPATTDWTV